MKKSIARGVLQEKNSGNRFLKQEGLKGEARGKIIPEMISSGGVFR